VTAGSTPQAWIGLMSGTSMDGVDGVLARIGPQGEWGGVIAHAHLPFEAPLRRELLALNTSGPDELHRAALAAQGVSRAYADVVRQLTRAVPDVTVSAIGAHGQTVRHRPELGYTLQLLAPALLAELTGLDVVSDFRSRDVAAGGQGAPLVPIFHQAVFAHLQHRVAALNVGGIANVSLLASGPAGNAPPPLGFDCGPGNVLMDLWVQRQRGLPYDADGAWAASGHVHADWLACALAEPYFALPAPKSTGRDLFHANWLDRWLGACGVDAVSLPDALAADVQATLCELTARSAWDAMAPHQPGEVLVCGGGALNRHLVGRLAALAAPHGTQVHSTDVRGLPPMEVEAAAFAWLAWACVHRHAGNVPAVTGAAGERVLGAVYPGR